MLGLEGWANVLLGITTETKSNRHTKEIFDEMCQLRALNLIYLRIEKIPIYVKFNSTIPAFSNEMQESKMFNILLTAEKVARFQNIFSVLVKIAQQ